MRSGTVRCTPAPERLDQSSRTGIETAPAGARAVRARGVASVSGRSLADQPLAAFVDDLDVLVDGLASSTASPAIAVSAASIVASSLGRPWACEDRLQDRLELRRRRP